MTAHCRNMAPDMRSQPTSSDHRRSQLHRSLTDLIVEIFRLNGDLIEAGDALVGDLGLTSARWQVLGAISLSPVALPVAHLARDMGLTRQSVQRVVDDLNATGLVRLDPNPHHSRAKLVAMTEHGLDAYEQAMARQQVWADDLAADLQASRITAAVDLLQILRRRLTAKSNKTDIE